MKFNIFNSVPARAPKRSAFSLSHDSKLTFEMGQLVPIFCEPVIPSDRLQMSSQHLIRFAPLQAPIMSNVDVYVHYFFVPNRLIWKDWETFITGSKNGHKLEESDVPLPPFTLIPPSRLNDNAQGAAGDYSFAHNGNNPRILENRSLADYLDFQTWNKKDLQSLASTAIGQSYPIDELPFRAYQRIWFDYYRDENLNQDYTLDNLFKDHSGNQTLNDSVATVDNYRLFALRQRSWRKDYFTSALPFAQAGDDVLIPGGVSVDPSSQLFIQGTGALHLSSGSVPTNQYLDVTARFDDPKFGDLYVDNGNGKIGATYQSISLLSGSQFNEFANSGASEGTIRELRRAFAAQKFLERRAIGGTRYNEMIRSFFGVVTSDARIQRAEFLGGMKQPVVISQILQTSESTENSPLGQPAGNAVSAGGKYVFDRTFEEYGFVIGIMSVMPRAEYMNGIPRKYQRKDVYDYYWPQFARIGEQPIYNSELYFNPTVQDSVNSGTFGYTPRYAEYRFCNNRIHGDFKDTLSFWHLGRSFDFTPSLNASFISCRPSTRIYAYEGQEYNHLWCDIHFNIKSLRPLPKYGESI